MVDYLNNIFSVFKQHYTLFHTLFHPHIFQKTTNNIAQTPLPNGPLVFTNSKTSSIYFNNTLYNKSNIKTSTLTSITLKYYKQTNKINIVNHISQPPSTSTMHCHHQPQRTNPTTTATSNTSTVAPPATTTNHNSREKKKNLANQ